MLYVTHSICPIITPCKSFNMEVLNLLIRVKCNYLLIECEMELFKYEKCPDNKSLAR